MEILRHGDTYKTTTCPKCHAYLSYTANAQMKNIQQNLKKGEKEIKYEFSQ